MRGQGERLRKGLEVQRAGGVGFILGNNERYGKDVPCDPHFIPATGVSYENALKIIQYVHSSSNPMAQLLPGRTVLKTKPAPSMASFSSRGPNVIDPNILKVIIPLTLSLYLCASLFPFMRTLMSYT
jgi:hypothetical protein